MNAYVIASVRSGIGEALSDIFPGCHVVPWRPLGHPPGKVGTAIAYVETAIANGQDHITYRAIRNAAEVTSKDFSRDIDRKPEWEMMLDRLGLERSGGARKTGLRRRPTTVIPKLACDDHKDSLVNAGYLHSPSTETTAPTFTGSDYSA
jgi:hypothetical protein